jgi:hypothetical protein
MAHSVPLRNVSAPIKNLKPHRLRLVHSGRISPADPRVPSGLTVPTGVIHDISRDVFKYVTPSGIHATYNQGTIVGSARLELLFWGDFWKTATNPSLGDVVQAARSIVASPYLSELNQYGFQSLDMGGATIVSAPPPPPGSYSGDDVRSLIWALIDNGNFPEPDDPGGRIIYMVFAPQGTQYANPDFPGAPGAHSDAEDQDFLVDWDHAWVGWLDHGTLDIITLVFTHELVEIITDPEPDSGWTTGLAAPFDEFADICVQQAGICTGFEVSAYFSKELNSCVVPCPPLRRVVDLSEQDVMLGTPLLLNQGDVTAPGNSECFSGSYHWWLWGQAEQITVTADVSSYAQPSIQWAVNGNQIFGSSTLTFPVDDTPDPLRDFQPLPAETADINATLSSDNLTLTLESKVGGGFVSFNVSCTVTEEQMPGYDTQRASGAYLSLSGRTRQMDARYRSDVIQCLAKHLRALETVVVQQVIPLIDKGDPVPPWVQQALVGLEASLETATMQGERVASFLVEGASGAAAPAIQKRQ